MNINKNDMIFIEFFLRPFEISSVGFLTFSSQPPEGILSEVFKLFNEQIKIKSMATGWSVT